jgi:hypothetical protein
MYQALLTCSLVWILTPRLCTYADSRLARNRFTSRNNAGSTQTQTTPSVQEQSLAEFCDALATSVRMGVNSSEAFHDHACRPNAPGVLHHIVQENNLESLALGDALVAVYRDTRGTPHESLAAQCLRDDDAQRAELRVETAHARVTARILTSFPVGCLFVGCLVSSSLRQSVLTPAIVSVLVLGIAINAAGWFWMHRLSMSISRTSHHDEFQRFTFALCVALQAGHSLVSACSTWRYLPPIGSYIAHQLDEGASLHTALTPLANNFGQPGHMLSRTISESAESGTPAISVAARLLADARSDSRRHVEFQLRQLPTKLTLPIVFCVLPAFLLVALMPFALAGLTSLPSTTLT